MNNTENQTPGLFALYTVFFVLALLATGFRLLSRRTARLSLWWDDYLILFATVVHSIGYGLLINALAKGGGKHVENIPPEHVGPYLQMTFGNEFVYVLTVSAAQISILCFYLRLFKVRKPFRSTVYSFIGLVVCWGISVFFSTLFQCTPVKLAFSEIPNQSYCINYRAWLLGTNIPHIIIDFSILCLPIHEIWQLSLSRPQKLGLTTVFLVGAFTSAISIIRTYFNASIALNDPTWDYTPVQLWSALEGWVSVICACLPSMAPLVRFSCSGRRFGKHRGNPYQPYTAKPQMKNTIRRRDDEEFSKLNEDQVELFDVGHTRSATAVAGRGCQHPVPLQKILVTSEFDSRSDSKI
ncbi:MAG: hypothetical protein Q9213_004794 [Squamulea squamosa]